MARKVKIPNHIKKQRERKETGRRENKRSKRKYFLIVCEGEKTEPNYFQSLKNALPLGVLEVIDFRILGEGYNTETLVERSFELKSEWENETGRSVDKLWVIFDKDSFTSEAFNNAIQTCENTDNVAAAWSNEAFELWYLLHFEYYNTAIDRETYKNRIQNNFRVLGLDGFIYRKNREDMFQLLDQYGDRNLAIRHAIRLEQIFNGQRNFADQNPCTTVYKLVVQLFNLDEELKEIEKPIRP